MEAKVRGWLAIIGALVAGYLAWIGNTKWSLIVLALLLLISGYHHITTKHKR